MPSSLEKASRATIVIVEDDNEIARLTSMLLEAEGYQCYCIHTGEGAPAYIEQQQPDLVILDIMLPGLDGIQVCQQIRFFYQGGIIMLTGRDDDITELSSFKSGADDFITKPIKPHLLLARIDALLKRTQNQSTANNSSDLVEIDGLKIDLARREVAYLNHSIDLSAAEFELLELFAKNIGTILSREACCQQLRGFDYDGMDRSIDMRISSLRKKLRAALGTKLEQPFIKTIRGKGYLLQRGHP